MSRDDREEEREEEREEKDHREPLTQREVFELYRYDPAVRPYLFGALGALAMVFVTMFLDSGSGVGSDVGALIVALFGLATLAFRWTAGPPLLLLFIFWFALFPFGLPGGEYDNPFNVRATHFRVMDVVLVLSVLVYLRCQYRIFGIVKQAMPFENMFRRKGDHPLRRPTGHIDPVEVAWVVGISVVLVVAGQMLWWLVNALEFAPTDGDFPLRWADTARPRFRRQRLDPGEFTPGQSRFFVLLGGLFFGFLAVHLVFGYWRARMMTAAEGAMMLTDTSWSESHRERVRVEKWRIWGRQRAAEERRRQVREERARREKEREDQARRERAEARRQERDRKSVV